MKYRLIWQKIKAEMSRAKNKNIIDYQKKSAIVNLLIFIFFWNNERNLYDAIEAAKKILEVKS